MSQKMSSAFSFPSETEGGLSYQNPNKRIARFKPRKNSPPNNNVGMGGFANSSGFYLLRGEGDVPGTGPTRARNDAPVARFRPTQSPLAINEWDTVVVVNMCLGQKSRNAEPARRGMRATPLWRISYSPRSQYLTSPFEGVSPTSPII